MADAGPERARNGLSLFAAAWFFYNFSYWLVMSYVPLHLESIGLTRAQVGYCIAMPQFMTLVTVLPFGYLSDRFPARRLSQTGLLLLGAWTTTLVLTTNRAVVTAAFGVAGVGLTLYLVSFNALFLKHLQHGGRGRSIGVFTFAEFMGYALGPLLIPTLQRLTGAELVTPGVYFTVAAGAFLLGAAAQALLRDSTPMPFHVTEYLSDIRSPRGYMAIGLILLYTTHFGAEQAFFPAFMREHVHLDQLGIGAVFAYSGVLIGIAALVAGRLFDARQSLFTTMAACMVFSGVFQALTGICDTFLGLLGIRTLHVLGDGAMNCYITLFVATSFPRHRLGGNFGFTYAVRTVAILVSAAVSGHLVDWAGLSMPFYVSGALGAVGGMLFLAAWPRLRPVAA